MFELRRSAGLPQGEGGQVPSLGSERSSSVTPGSVEEHSAGPLERQRGGGESKFRLVILTGQDTPSMCFTISMLAKLREVEIAGILFESAPVPFKRRLRNLRRNVRREGLSYLFYRLGGFIEDFSESLAARVISRTEVMELLRQSFPERPFSLEDLSKRHGIPIFNENNLNDDATVRQLKGLNADLGIVIGTRILKRSTFSVPRLGCVNLHKGKVPEYRGLPPGFWELYESQEKAGVTVHFVDDGLDTGDIVGEGVVPIHPKDSPVTLARKLDLCGAEVLAQSVAALAKGQSMRRPQPPSNRKARTSPTRLQRRQLDERLGLGSQRQKAWVHVLKTFYYLAMYYSGLFHLLRAARQMAGGCRACVLLYHRVNDLADDPLTTSVERFAEHMVTLRNRYSVIPTSDLVKTLKSDGRLPSNAVLIHFDDCYRDVFKEASRVLTQVKYPACCFVSSGYVGTDKVFSHDAEGCPFILENLDSHELPALVDRGFEVGAHTVNHVDLGQCSLDEASKEVKQSREDLEKVLGRPVKVFSYPFGKKTNIRAEVAGLVKQAGYEALFSAYGGYVTKSSDLFNLPRTGASGNTRPLDLLMEIEGVSLGALKVRLKGLLSKRR